jgi:hypothetical protein
VDEHAQPSGHFLYHVWGTAKAGLTLSGVHGLGAVAMAGIGRAYLLCAAQGIEKTSIFGEAGIMAVRGAYLYFRSGADRRGYTNAVGVLWLPRPHFEFSATHYWRVRERGAYLTAHFWL